MHDPAVLSYSTAEIDLTLLRNNARILVLEAGPAHVMAVVKADAYRHGAVAVAQSLRAEGIRHFLVAHLGEALALRNSGIRDTILVASPPRQENLPLYRRYALDVTLASQDDAAMLIELGDRKNPFQAHLKVDTGLGRLGVTPQEAMGIARRLQDTPQVRIAGVWTHLSTAQEADQNYAIHQLDRFQEFDAGCLDAGAWVHTGNSSALLNLQSHVRYPHRGLIRVGGALYGVTYLPEKAQMLGLRPILRFTSRVVQVKSVPSGAAVSYGRTWEARHETRIATVAAGYADGYPLRLSNTGQVGINGKRYPVVGRVCMDMFMVDLGPGEGLDEVKKGDEVVLFGEGGPTLYEVADWAGMAPYEVLCAISARVPRHYR